MKKRTPSIRSTRTLDLATLANVIGGEDAPAKKPYQLTYKFAPEMLKFESGTGAQ